MEIVEQTFDEKYKYHDSDQFYFQNLWAEQEVERTRLRDGVVHPPFVGNYRNGQPVRGWMPKIAKGQRTEYRVALDYNATLFQTAAGKSHWI